MVKKKKWNLPSFAFARLKPFVQAVSASGWTLVCFIDHCTQTDETLKKWQARRNKEVLTGERRVPQSSPIMLGDMFKSLGVPVHYSFDADNDDTLVNSLFNLIPYLRTYCFSRDYSRLDSIRARIQACFAAI